jgi:hypothetical protein
MDLLGLIGSTGRTSLLLATLGTMCARAPGHYMSLHRRWIPKCVVRYLIKYAFINILCMFDCTDTDYIL